MRDLWDAGVNVALSSDYDVGELSPFVGIAAAVERGWAAGMMQEWIGAVLRVSKHVKTAGRIAREHLDMHENIVTSFQGRNAPQ